MRSKIILILAVLVKGLVIGFINKLLIENINTKIEFYEQNLIVWIFLYIPLFMGYESIIALIFNHKTKQNE